MRLVELPSDPALVEQLAAQPNPSRSTGVHVSSVIRWIDGKTLHPGQRKAYDELTDTEKVRMGAYTTGGWLWEEIVRRALIPVLGGGELHHVGEVGMDGITGTPDGLLINGREWLEEYKATWRSSRRPLETDFRTWLWQIKSYCHMTEIPRARLRAMFVNGDYRDSGPQIKQWELEFSARELEENWMMITNNARAMQNETRR